MGFVFQTVTREPFVRQEDYKLDYRVLLTCGLLCSQENLECPVPLLKKKPFLRLFNKIPITDTMQWYNGQTVDMLDLKTLLFSRAIPWGHAQLLSKKARIISQVNQNTLQLIPCICLRFP